MENTNQSDVILGALGTMSIEDRDSLIAMLQQSGYYVDSSSSQDELLSDSLKAIRDSSKFRIYLEQYLKKLTSMSSFSGDDEGFYSNSDGSTKKSSALGGLLKKKEGGTAVGNAFRQNIGVAIGAGIGALSTKLADSSAKKGNEQAIAFETAKAKTAAEQANLLQRQLEASQSVGGGVLTGSPDATQKGGKKWVLPVAIGGGVLVIGAILFFVLRKK
jgi:hypothetical protein